VCPHLPAVLAEFTATGQSTFSIIVIVIVIFFIIIIITLIILIILKCSIQMKQSLSVELFIAHLPLPQSEMLTTTTTTTLIIIIIIIIILTTTLLIVVRCN